MGWGLELLWADLLALGHDGDDEKSASRPYSGSRGLESLRELQRTIAARRTWQNRPPWLQGALPGAHPAR